MQEKPFSGDQETPGQIEKGREVIILKKHKPAYYGCENDFCKT
jgi:hypothetical protein